jgi:hypothetical protein
MLEHDSVLYQYTAEYVDVCQRQSLEHEEAAVLASKVMQALAYCSDQQAWNALCLLWSTYHELLSESVPTPVGLPISKSGANANMQVVWLQMHEICSKLACRAETAAPERTIALLNAQIAFNSARVRSSCFNSLFYCNSAVRS